MFEKLKTKTHTVSHFEDRHNPSTYSKSPGVTHTVIKGNEASRLVRCRHCGWICDKERDVRLPSNSYGKLGIHYGEQLTMGTTVGDNKTPAAGVVSGTPQGYYVRNVSSGCPCCGSYLYDPNERIIRI